MQRVEIQKRKQRGIPKEQYEFESKECAMSTTDQTLASSAQESREDDVKENLDYDWGKTSKEEEQESRYMCHRSVSGSYCFGGSQSLDKVGEEISFPRGGESVCELLHEVCEFLPGGGLPLPPAEGTDDDLAEYMENLLINGKAVAEGEKTLASLEYQHSSLKGKLVRSRESLRGWRKEKLPTSRLPIPMLVAHGLSMLIFAQGQKMMALKLILDFDTYMRPGESIDLVKQNVIPPVKKAGAQYQWFAVVVRDYDQLKPDMQGGDLRQFDPTRQQELQVDWGDSLPPCQPTDKVFDFRMEDSGKHLQEVGKRLGLNGVHPYPLRHGGAAEDLNGRLQDHTAVKARGRWSTDTSLRRYTKVGKVQRMMLMNQVSPGALEYCRWSARNLSKVFQGKALPERG